MALSKRILIFLFSVAAFLIISPRNKAQAADFVVTNDITYTVDADASMHIKEVKTIKNSSSGTFYIPASSEETFIISAFKTRSETSKQDLEKVAATISLTDSNGNELTPQIEIKDKYIEAKINFGTNLTKGREKVFVLEYDNFELAMHKGNVLDVYLPGLPEGYNSVTTSDSGATTQVEYSISLYLAASLGKPTFVLPEPASSVEESSSYLYKFDPANLIKNTVWIQIGDLQYYYFEMKQEVKGATTLGSKVFNTWIDLLLPRDSEFSNQKVYFKEFSPEPKYIKTDGEGNLVARFEFKSGEDTEITISGYITVNMTSRIDESNSGSISNIDLSKVYSVQGKESVTLVDLLKSEEFWEVDASEIQDAAHSIKGSSTNVYDIVLADYQYIADHVDYDNLKRGTANERQGALKTLEGGSSVCMEYSDLLITLLRAQGIPARAAFGYGYDPKDSDTQEGHQWVEVYMPQAGWVAVDPTWGDTGRREYIGGDIDHALWYVAGTNVYTPSPVVKYALSDPGEVAAPEFKIEALSDVNLTDLLTQDDLLNKYPYTSRLSLEEKFEQLNVYGKIIFLGIPGIILLLIVILVFRSLVKFVSKVFRKKVI